MEQHSVLIVTQDKKCILRGKDKYNLQLCLRNERSRFKVREFRSTKTALSSINTMRIKVSDEVKNKYNLENNNYNKEKMGELVAVKVKVTYIEEGGLE